VIRAPIGSRARSIVRARAISSYILFESLIAVVIGLYLGIGGLAGAAIAQNQSLVQPWGLPPLPPGIGPVEKFADVSNAPQGQFLEGGAFDTQGNLWFVAIANGWVSYLTPDGKLVPAFNCYPPAELGQPCDNSLPFLDYLSLALSLPGDGVADGPDWTSHMRVSLRDAYVHGKATVDGSNALDVIAKSCPGKGF